MPRELYIGLMSGTSLDGVDGVLMAFPSPGEPGVEMLAEASLDMPTALRCTFLALNQPGPDELHRSAVAAHQLAHLYAQAVQQLLHTTGLPAHEVRAIGAHGQTVRHHPPGFTHGGNPVSTHSPDNPPYTLQLNQPALLAELTGISVVADFRSRDMAAGGQGAPLVPAFHREVFGAPGQALAVVNIGGIANITTLHACGQVQGLDTGPGNVLLDWWCARHTGQTYDRQGQWGAQGQCCPGLLQAMLQEPYFQRTGLKSTGRDLFNPDWLQRHLQAYPALSATDVQATLAELTAQTIAQGIQQHPWGAQRPEKVLVCGGGAYNTDVMQRLQRQLPATTVTSTAAHGWPVMTVEAAAFAWLARQTVHGRAGNEPQATGASGPRILGAIYPA